MTVSNKNVLIIGTGKSGVAAATLLSKKGANVYLYDANDSLDATEIKNKTEDNVHVVLGELGKDIEEKIQLVVISPGVPIDSPLVEKFRNKGITISGEIELAYQLSIGKLVAITGTNGKTTTTSLVGEIMKAYYESVFVVGNIGNPYTSIALETREDSVVVAEISSFQLETTDTFHPAVSAILNITPDHLNRHHTMENYIDTKFRIQETQTKDDVCVLNYEDEVLRERAKSLNADIWFFSSQRELSKGIYLTTDKYIVYTDGNKKETICKTTDLNLLGTHNYENVMAAVLMAMKMNVPMDIIKKVICEFHAVEHRIEYVCEKNGVKFYNDSKGTNPDAAIRGIKAMESDTFLIGGGYDKQSDFTEWIQAFDGKVKLLVLIGQTREQIKETAEKCGFHNTVFAESLEEAVNICYENAKSGECVLLSPACASWGMFDNYEQRGEMFKDIAKCLKS